MGEPAEVSIEERIRRAALRLFNERGYGATTVDAIAREAGVGVGSLYRRWPDKPSLANEVYSQVFECIRAHQARLTRPKSRKARFINLLRSFSDFAKAEPQMLLFLVGQPHDAYLDPQNKRRQQQSDAEVLDLITELRLTAPPDLAAAMTMGTIAQCVRTGTNFDGADLAERLWLALSK